MCNFQFLHSEWPSIFTKMEKAEECINTDPDITGVKPYSARLSAAVLVLTTEKYYTSAVCQYAINSFFLANNSLPQLSITLQVPSPQSHSPEDSEH